LQIVPPFSKPLCLSLWKDLTSPAPKLEDDTIHNFVSRRFGQEVADYAVSALVCGVCAGNAKKISVNLLMSGLFQNEQLHGSIIKGVIKSVANREIVDSSKSLLATRANVEKWSVWSLSGGLETLPARIGEVLREDPNVELQTETPCESIEFSSDECQVNSIQGLNDHLPSLSGS